MKILFADDHELVRDTISSFLAREPGFQITVVGTFGEACERLKKEAPFDLVLLDWNMPGMAGLESLATAKALNFGSPVGLISGTADRTVAEQALAAGAAGFLPKSMPAKSLVHAIRFMAAGEQYAPISFMTEKEPENPLASKLTSREMQVLAGLVEGRSNKEIALTLDLQEVTVKLHVKTLCKKLDARNRTHAAIIAKNLGAF